MKRGLFGLAVSVFLSLSVLGFNAHAAKRVKLYPYILAFDGAAEFSLKLKEVRERLTSNGFDIIGEYPVYEEGTVLVFTNDTIIGLAARTEMGGYGAAMRVSVVKNGDNVQVAYVNPTYMAHIYRMDTKLSATEFGLDEALDSIKPFGTKKLTVKKLRKYRYTFGMEYFTDPYELGEFTSHDEAVRHVEDGLAENATGIGKIYRLDIPGREEVVFGVSMTAPNEEMLPMDDKHQMGVVDFDKLKQTAYLPYEVMVRGNQVVALHMRFRMAAYFPGLRMMGKRSFMALMSSPDAIERALRAAVGTSTQDASE